MPPGESARDLVEPHLATGEEPRAVRTDEGRVTVVTDRRLVRASEHGVDGREATDVESVMLASPHVLGARIRTRPEPDPEWGQAGLGGLFAAVGVLLGYAAVAGGVLGPLLPDGFGLVLGLAALVLVPSGMYLASDALRTEDGHVEVRVLSTGEDTVVRLPTGAGGIANAVSTVVGGE
ncbi:hypothetical protein [Halosegnis marinus]|uniref:Uncharacterized protein n=1 Tax=Halosegnis marinus TaxID=3034023 RepID=A0ABD5ZLH6_9EURY|nr:hypothetical protein [Halosegnis sp. DT85]